MYTSVDYITMATMSYKAYTELVEVIAGHSNLFEL